MTETGVCFVIPHRGRDDLLNLTLTGIARLDDAGQSISVNVVSQSIDSNIEMPEKLDGEIIPASEELTVASLRNIGAERSTSPYLAFVDADVELSTNWLTELLPRLQQDERVAMVACGQAPGANAGGVEKIRSALASAERDKVVSQIGGANMLVEREAFIEAGRFPEHLVTCEDTFFSQRIAMQGDIVVCSAAQFVHLGEDKTLGEMFRKEIWRAQSNLQSLVGRPVSVREWPSLFVPGWITLMAFTAVILAITGPGMMAALAALGALLPFVVYVTRLYIQSRGRIGLAPIVAFYACYFPARAWGTLIGAFKQLRHKPRGA